MAMIWNLRKKKPSIRPDANTYVSHGGSWGNAIQYKVVGPNELDIHGWLAYAPFPVAGDRLLVKMQSGRWASYAFTSVERTRDPVDMFFAKASGPVDFWPEEIEPQTSDCDEFIDPERMSPFARA